MNVMLRRFSACSFGETKERSVHEIRQLRLRNVRSCSVVVITRDFDVSLKSGVVNFPRPRFEPWQDLERFIFTARVLPKWPIRVVPCSQRSQRNDQSRINSLPRV
jgi:hypothetical protein